MSTAWRTASPVTRTTPEDLTQETFIRVFRSLADYKPGTFEGWLHRITTNLFLDMVRRRARLRMEGLPERLTGYPAAAQSRSRCSRTRISTPCSRPRWTSSPRVPRRRGAL